MQKKSFLNLIVGKKIIKAFRLYGLAISFLPSAQRRQSLIFAELRSQLYDEFWRNAAQTVNATIEDTGYGYLKIAKNGHWTLVRNSEVMLDDHLTCNVTGNKPFIHNFLSERGYPTPHFLEFDLLSVNRAKEFLRNLDGRAVVKPAYGGYAGRGVTTRISTAAQLKRAAYRATCYCKKILIEKEIQGHSYRLLFLDGEFIDAVKREPPAIVGDGVTSIKGLIAKENAARAVDAPITALWPLTMDLECKITLQEQNLSLRDAPAKGLRVIAKYVVNQNKASENHIIRDNVHPEYIKAGKTIMRQLGLKLGGLDIITDDISSFENNGGWIVNEVNANPGLHHHMLVNETLQRAPVGEQILEYLFAKKILID